MLVFSITLVWTNRGLVLKVLEGLVSKVPGGFNGFQGSGCSKHCIGSDGSKCSKDIGCS